MIIYKATNKVTGKIYIGQTIQPLHKRWKDHCRGDRGHDSYLHRAIAKHGVENFTIEQIDTAETIEELNLKEQTYIKAFNCLAPSGYNLLPGGDNRTHHPDTRERIRQKLKGKPLAVHWSLGRSHPHSEETKERIRQKLKGRPITNRWNKGNPTPRTEEQKAHLSEMNKGKPNKALFKAVVCSNGMEFESVNEAAAHFGITRQTIHYLIKEGRKGRLGHSFKFKDAL